MRDHLLVCVGIPVFTLRANRSITENTMSPKKRIMPCPALTQENLINTEPNGKLGKMQECKTYYQLECPRITYRLYSV